MTEIEAWHDIYDNPEKFGLEIVGQIGDGGYDWSYLVVWRDEDGKLFWGDDSGCSCSNPWSYEQDTSSLRPLNASTWGEFVKGVGTFINENSYHAKFECGVKLLAKVSPLVPRAQVP